jgi:hypothetical protein
MAFPHAQSGTSVELGSSSRSNINGSGFYGDNALQETSFRSAAYLQQLDTADRQEKSEALKT